MQLLILLINTVILVLTEIGDFVLFYLGLVWKASKALIKLIFRLIFGAFKFIGKSTQKSLTYSQTAKANIVNRIKLINFRLLLFSKRFKRQLRPKKKARLSKKKEAKETVITFFPAPKYYVLKLKYFVVGFLFCVIFVLIPFSIYTFLTSLPNPKLLTERDFPQTTKIFDRNGTLLYQIYANENRTLVSLNSIPKNLINATIAIEDKDFYTNPGFDINSIIRAALADASGKPIQGGSTITQQLIKSTLLTPEVSLTRKIKEIVLAFWAERLYSKNQILEMYFNQVPYGGTAWGIEAAAETYFGKNVKDLDLAQSAFLAGMPQAPTTYSPYGDNPTLWKQRQTDVLNKMYELSYISKAQDDQALSENLTFQPPQIPIYAPHFVMYVKDLLVQRYGLAMVEKGGLNVTTSLDLNLQQDAQQIVTDEVTNDAYLNLTNGAALVTNPANGDILAMVGSTDYNAQNGGNVNLTTALRQPGSSIKVVTYSTALSDGFTAASILDDSPITYNIPGSAPYSPVNYDGTFHGRVPLRIAFANSFNVPAVKTLQKIGIPAMVDMAKKMGITTWGNPDQYGLSLTLGAAEVKMTDMATVYGTIANLGKRVDLDPILKVTNYDGSVNYQKQEELPNLVLDPGVAFIISNILADNSARSLEFGLNSPLNIPNHTVSVKTGTSDNKRDNWTFGFTPNYLVAVWVGNNDNSPMSQTLASGITGAAPIWNKIMTLLLGNASSAAEQMPDDVVIKKCQGRNEYFIKGTENAPDCNFIATPSATIIPPSGH
ncbi:MAG: transglycosylase domain-containing protein [Candidatus Levyibacteriota bacterium]|jgi:penicillin-binding protein 1C